MLQNISLLKKFTFLFGKKTIHSKKSQKAFRRQKIKRHDKLIIPMPKNRRRNQAEGTGMKRPRIPNYRNEELLGVVTEVYGGEHLGVKGEDGILYMGLIRGKIKKRMWCRVSDVVVISPWNFETIREDKKRKCHIIWRYTRTQTTWLQNHNYIKESFLEDLHNI